MATTFLTLLYHKTCFHVPFGASFAAIITYFNLLSLYDMGHLPIDAVIQHAHIHLYVALTW